MMRLVVAASVMGLCAIGCTLDTSKSEKYREPLPAQGSVALALPGSGSASTGGIRTLNGNGGGGAATGATSDAEFYSFSRDITDAIDSHTAIVLSLIWLVAQQEPTSLEDKRAVWGPFQGNALDPVTWRLVVNEVADDEYNYALEGRPKASTNEADFKAIIHGHGYGKGHASHDSGWFEADNETFRTLDPARGKDRGKHKVTYDLRQFPKSIAVSARPGDGSGEAEAEVKHLAQGAGVLTLSATADIEDDGQKDSKLETVSVKSQWNASGAGRADVEISGGSLPTTVQKVSVVECWSSSFTLAYYNDSIGIKPASGAENACPAF